MFEGLFNFANLSNHLILIGVYAILALSLNLINGSLGAFSLGHHAFWGMGAYASAVTVWAFGAPDGSIAVFVISFLVAAIASGLFGMLVGAPCLRLRGDYLAIATLGFGEIFIICARNSESWTSFGERGLGGKAGFSVGAGHSGGTGNDVVLSLVGPTGRYVFYLLLTWGLVALTFVFIRNIIRSGHGRAIQAIRDDETAAELMGVQIVPHKVMVFVIGAALAGMAGAISANYRSFVSPEQFPMMEGIKVLLIVVLGGLGSMSGAVLAAVVLYASEQALGTIDLNLPFPAFSSTNGFSLTYKPIKDLWQVLFALVLIVLMLGWPRGLTGGREFSRAFFQDVFAAARARFTRGFRSPGHTALRAIQWVQLLVMLPLSEKMTDDRGQRLMIVAASIAVFVALSVVRRRVFPRPEEVPA